MGRKILMVCQSMSPFVERDVRILEDMGNEVKPFLWDPKDLLKLALKIGPAVRGSTHIISWFIGDHSFFSSLWARTFGRKSLVILGGWDAARLPEIPYGAWCNPSRTQQYRLRHSISWPNEAWVVEESMIERVSSYSGIERAFRVVPTIFDSEVFKCEDEKADQVATVLAVEDDSRAVLKGLPDFIEVARRIPEVPFLVVGVSQKFLQRFGDIPANMKATGYLSTEPLSELLSQTKVYCNFSLSEGLNNSLCEAMLCECVPVVADIPGNLAAIRNDQGLSALSATPHDVDSFVDLIKTGLKSDGRPYRNLIISKFPPSKRIEAFRRFLVD